MKWMAVVAVMGGFVGTVSGEPLPVEPDIGDAFWVLPDGTDLAALAPSGYDLIRRAGLDREDDKFTVTKERRYFELKFSSKVRWAIRDLDSEDVIAFSTDAEGASTASKNFYGASVHKALVAAALLWNTDGLLSDSQWSDMIRLIIASKSDPWDPFEDAAGEREGMEAFADAMGYDDIGPWRWKADGVGNNSLNPITMTQFLADLHHQRIPGSRPLMRIMAACRTGKTRAQAYLPPSVYVGGKTGSYSTTGANHELRFVEIDGKRYGVAVFTELGSKNYDDVGIVFGGLVREYLLGSSDELGDGIGGVETAPPPTAAGCQSTSGGGALAGIFLALIGALLRRQTRTVAG